MGIILGNTLKTAAASGSDTMTLDGAPEGQHAGIGLFISRPVNVTGAHTPAVADLIAYLNQAIASIQMDEKVPNSLRAVLANVGGGDLRELHRLATGQEVYNDFVSVAKVINAADIWRARLFIPFTPPAAWLRSARASRKPGHTQVRALAIRVTEGTGVISANASRGAGTQTIDVEFSVEPGADQHAPLLTMVKETSPRRDATGPDGVTLAVYQAGQAASASPLAAYVVDAGKRRVVNVQTVQTTVRDTAAMVADSGRANINDTDTVLYQAPFGERLEAQPAGQVRVEEGKSDLAFDLRFVTIPARDEAAARAFAAYAASAYGRRVLFTQKPAEVEEDPGMAAIEPATIIPETDARFSTLPGIVGMPGTDTTAVVVPDGWRARAAQLKGNREADDAKRKLRKVASLMVPGATGTDGGRTGTLGATIDATFA
jgi:hypothetical protein